jgi:hypothetical protein
MKRLYTAVAVAIGIGASQAAPPSQPNGAPDFSQVTSHEAALKLASEGKLFKILLFPPEFGGEDVAPNIVYVPAGIPEIKDKITGSLIRFYNDGLIDRLNVQPEYKGKSFVPSKIHFKATHSQKKGSFEPTIDIW